MNKPTKKPLFARISLRNKLVIVFLSISLIPMLLVGMFTYFSIKNTTQSQKIDQLETIAGLKADKVGVFYDKLHTFVEVSQDYYNVKTHLPVVSKNIENRDSLVYTNAKEVLDSQLQTFRESNNFLEFLLLNVDGEVVYTTQQVHKEDELGTTFIAVGSGVLTLDESDFVFTPVFKSEFAPSGFEILVAGRANDIDGNFIGYIVLAVDMGPVYDTIQDIAGLGETGETLIGVAQLSSDGELSHVLFVNPLRHDPNSALSREVFYGDTNAIPIQEATRERGGSGISIDYRGKEVVAAWRYIPGFDWGLVAKVDVDEAFASLAMLRDRALLFGGTFSVVLIWLAYWFSRSVMQPLVKLRDLAKEVASGKMNTTFDASGSDEVGELGAAFNSMILKLKESYGGLKEKTDELTIAKLNLEDQQKALTNVLEDVTEEKILGERRSQSILETLGEGVVITNERGEITYANTLLRFPSCQRQAKFKHATLTGSAFLQDKVSSHKACKFATYI